MKIYEDVSPNGHQPCLRPNRYVIEPRFLVAVFVHPNQQGKYTVLPQSPSGNDKQFAIEAMAHEHSWFTELKDGDFP